MKRRTKISLFVFIGIPVLIYLVHFIFRSPWAEFEGYEDFRLEPNFEICEYEDLPEGGFFAILEREADRVESFNQENEELVQLLEQFVDGHRTDEINRKLSSTLINRRPEFLNGLKKIPTYKMCPWPYQHLYSPNIVPYSEIENICNWLMADSYYHAKAEKWSRVKHDIAILATIASSRQTGSFIDTLIGAFTIEALASHLMELYQSCEFPVDVKMEIVKILEFVNKNRIPYKEFLRAEFVEIRSSIAKMYDGDEEYIEAAGIRDYNGPPFWWSLLGSTKENTDKICREFSAYLLSNMEDPEFSPKISFKAMAERSFFFIEDPIGFIIAQNLFYSSLTGFDAVQRAKFKVSAFAVWLALREYRKKHGKNAEALADLVPVFLESTPVWGEDDKPIYLIHGKDTWYLVNEQIDEKGLIDSIDKRGRSNQYIYLSEVLQLYPEE